jgi:hypothetical protein
MVVLIWKNWQPIYFGDYQEMPLSPALAVQGPLPGVLISKNVSRESRVDNRNLRDKLKRQPDQFLRQQTQGRLIE